LMNAKILCTLMPPTGRRPAESHQARWSVCFSPDLAAVTSVSRGIRSIPSVTW
jgi:hypothetical protein